MMKRRHLLMACLLGSLGLGTMSNAYASDATLMQAELTLDEPGQKPGVFVSASYEFDLPHTLHEALHRGIPLYFAHEFQLSRERWYWIDKTIVEEKFIIRLAFNPLTQRYRLSYNGFSQDYDSLEQVLPYIKSVRRWRVADIENIQHDGVQVAIRFYLDTTKLPKAMQVTNSSLSDWTIQSGWHDIPIPASFTHVAS